MATDCMVAGYMTASDKAVGGRAACVMAVCGRATDCDCGKATGGSASLVTSSMVDKPSVDPDALGMV